MIALGEAEYSALNPPGENGHDQVGESGAGASLHPRLAWMMMYNETKSAQAVCRKFGISRKTFYKWLKRYRETNGDTGALADRSRRPHRFPRATPEDQIAILKMAKQQTGYGQTASPCVPRAKVQHLALRTDHLEDPETGARRGVLREDVIAGPGAAQTCDSQVTQESKFMSHDARTAPHVLAFFLCLHNL